eukprot:1137411-Pelagomonas_calceolata.AAC.2
MAQRHLMLGFYFGMRADISHEPVLRQKQVLECEPSTSGRAFRAWCNAGRAGKMSWMYEFLLRTSQFIDCKSIPVQALMQTILLSSLACLPSPTHLNVNINRVSGQVVVYASASEGAAPVYIMPPVTDPATEKEWLQLQMLEWLNEEWSAPTTVEPHVKWVFIVITGWHAWQA